MQGMPSGPQTLFPMPTIQEPPSWASEIMEDIKQIKQSVSKIENIEKTVNSIQLKMSDLEVKVNQIDDRVTQVENACSFISEKHDEHKQYLDKSKKEIQTLQNACNRVEQIARDSEERRTQLNQSSSTLKRGQCAITSYFMAYQRLHLKTANRILKTFA